MSDPIKRAGIILGILIAAVAAFFTVSIAAPAHAQEGKPHWILELNDGIVDIELRPDLAPGHVKRVIELTEKGFYNGIVFHRVIDGFMAQGGDPTGTGMGGSDLPDLPAEFTTAEHFTRGVVAAARSSDPNSANSQFFIMFADAPHLDGQYTVWGEVVEGMEHVDNLPKGEPPRAPGRIVKASLRD